MVFGGDFIMNRKQFNRMKGRGNNQRQPQQKRVCETPEAKGAQKIDTQMDKQIDDQMENCNQVSNKSNDRMGNKNAEINHKNAESMENDIKAIEADMKAMEAGMKVIEADKGAILVNGYAYPSIAPEILNQWLPDLTFVSTFSYGLTADGELVQLDDENIIVPANRVGVMSLMVLTPLDEEGIFNDEIASELFRNPIAKQNLIDNILANIRAKNMFGVDFDFEYIQAEFRDDYTSLVESATLQLNAEGYIVTAALAPKVSADQEGLLYEGIDYEGLGAAANLVTLMTYEWGYTFGPPLPVAPINEVRRVLDFGVSVINPEKILMGIPNYGYDWTLPYVKGTRARKVTLDEAVQIAERYGVEIFYDEVAQSPYFYYTNEEGIEHVVWFEDARSMRAKLNLITEYGLAGACYWNIMSYFADGSAVLNEMFTVAKV